MSNISLTSMSTDVNNISALGDRPNETDNLTSTQLKAKFDQAGNDLKNFINTSLIPEITSQAASKMN